MYWIYYVRKIPIDPAYFGHRLDSKEITVLRHIHPPLVRVRYSCQGVQSQRPPYCIFLFYFFPPAPAPVPTLAPAPAVRILMVLPSDAWLPPAPIYKVHRWHPTLISHTQRSIFPILQENINYMKGLYLFSAKFHANHFSPTRPHCTGPSWS